MNIEQVEHILDGLNGNAAIVVVPLFGHASLSISGILSVVNRECPMIFTVTSSPAALFDSNDIASIELPQKADRGPKVIIRLKGPHDYIESYQTAGG